VGPAINIRELVRKITPRKWNSYLHLFFRPTFLPVQAFQTNILKKSPVFIGAEKFKNVTVKQETVFLFSHYRLKF
jgi:hypothetical protein